MVDELPRLCLSHSVVNGMPSLLHHISFDQHDPAKCPIVAVNIDGEFVLLLPKLFQFGL